MRGFIIDRDVLAEEDGEVGLAGQVTDRWRDGEPIADGPEVKFRLYDDDDNLYYEGRFGDAEDEYGDTQGEAVLNFGEAWAGCSYVKVLRNGRWIQEIG